MQAKGKTQLKAVPWLWGAGGRGDAPLEDVCGDSGRKASLKPD